MPGFIRFADVILLAASSTPALAQTRPMVDVAAGVAGGRGRQAGVAAQIGFEFRPVSTLPIEARADLSHHQWHDGVFNSRQTARGTAATLDLVYRLPTTRVRPYVLGGVLAYAEQGLGLNPGWNVGGGLEVPVGRYGVFGEIRGHFLSTELHDRLTPLVLGIRF